MDVCVGQSGQEIAVCTVDDHRCIGDDHFAGGADRRNAVTLNNHRLAGFDAVTIHPNQIDIDDGKSRCGTQRPVSGPLTGRGVSHAQNEEPEEGSAFKSSQYRIHRTQRWSHEDCEHRPTSPTQLAIRTKSPTEYRSLRAAYYNAQHGD